MRREDIQKSKELDVSIEQCERQIVIWQNATQYRSSNPNILLESSGIQKEAIIIDLPFQVMRALVLNGWRERLAKLELELENI